MVGQAKQVLKHITNPGDQEWPFLGSCVILNPILQTRQLRPREANQLVPNHTAGRWQSHLPPDL